MASYYTYTGNTSESGVPQDNYIVALKVDPEDFSTIGFLASTQADEVTGDFTLTWKDWAGRVTIGAIDSSLSEIKDPVFRDQVAGVLLPTSITDTDHPDLLAFYTMDNVSGSNVIDESPNGYDAVNVGNTFGAGYINNAMISTQDASQLNLTALDGLARDNFSASLWFYIEAGTTGQTKYIFGSAKSEGVSSVLLLITGDKITLLGREELDDQNVVWTSTDQTLDEGVWYHAVAQIDEGTTSIYLNGVKTGTSTTDVLPAEGTDTALGNAIQGNQSLNWRGKIDQFRFFNRGLTQEEITILANET